MYTTSRCTTLHFTTLHYTTLHCTLHHSSLHHTTPHYTNHFHTAYIGSIVGIDPLLHGARAVKKIEETLLPKSIIIKEIEKNPIDKIWTQNRSPIPTGLLRIHPSEYAGKSVVEKLVDIRAVLLDNQVRKRKFFYLTFR